MPLERQPQYLVGPAHYLIVGVVEEPPSHPRLSLSNRIQIEIGHCAHFARSSGGVKIRILNDLQGPLYYVVDKAGDGNDGLTSL